MDNWRVVGKAESRKCAKCETPYAVTYQTVKSRGRERDLPFCLPCWRRLRVAIRMFMIAAAFDVVVLVGGVVLLATTGRYVPLAVAAVVGGAAVVGALVFLRSARPQGV